MLADESLTMRLPPTALLRDAIRVLDEVGQQIVLVCDDELRLQGTVTDGDVRRALLRGLSLDGASVASVMQRDFISVRPEANRAEVLDTMRARSISHVPVVDSDGKLAGLHTIRELIGAKERPNWAFIMAGGLGTRLRPITEDIPKPMIRVAGRPMLERLILHVIGYGIRHIVLSVNYLGHIVEDYFGDGSSYGCRIDYVRETEPLGTAGSLTLLKEIPNHPLLVMNGDLVTQFDVARILGFHDEGNYMATMGIRQHAIPIPFGVVDLDGSEIRQLAEKPVHRMLVNAGIYVLSPTSLALAERNKPLAITELFQRCLDHKYRVGAHFIEEDWADVGRPEELLRANGVI